MLACNNHHRLSDVRDTVYDVDGDHDCAPCAVGNIVHIQIIENVRSQDFALVGNRRRIGASASSIDHGYAIEGKAPKIRLKIQASSCQTLSKNLIYVHCIKVQRHISGSP